MTDHDIAGYTPYHPRWYRRRMSVWWWLKDPAYTKFVLRELTSVFVAYAALLYLWLLRVLARGPDPYQQFMARLDTPLFLTVNGIAFVLVVYHTITWFNLTPTAIVVRRHGKRVPAKVVAGTHYIAWVLLSAIVAWIFTGGLT